MRYAAAVRAPHGLDVDIAPLMMIACLLDVPQDGRILSYCGSSCFAGLRWTLYADSASMIAGGKEVLGMLDVDGIVASFCREHGLDARFSADMPEGYETANGSFDIAKNTLFFNTAMLAGAPDCETLFYLFHELRHALQYSKPELMSPLVRRSLPYVIMYDGRCFKFADGAWAGCALEGTSDHLSDVYLGQPYEMDANEFAYDRTRSVLGPSEHLERLLRMWTPKEKPPDSEYERIYNEIDRMVGGVC